jgi:hypothetical protein
MSFLPPTYPADCYADDLRVRAEYRWESQSIELRFIHYHGLGGQNISVAEPLVMRPYDRDGSDRVSPALYLKTHTAQHLMDQLWQCGLRPTEGTGSAGSLAATQRHLEDMRTIAFKKLDIPNENGPQVSKVAR